MTVDSLQSFISNEMTTIRTSHISNRKESFVYAKGFFVSCQERQNIVGTENKNKYSHPVPYYMSGWIQFKKAFSFNGLKGIAKTCPIRLHDRNGFPFLQERICIFHFYKKKRKKRKCPFSDRFNFFCYFTVNFKF